jgi:hypothetical protein
MPTPHPSAGADSTVELTALFNGRLAAHHTSVWLNCYIKRNVLATTICWEFQSCPGTTVAESWFFSFRKMKIFIATGRADSGGGIGRKSRNGNSNNGQEAPDLEGCVHLNGMSPISCGFEYLVSSWYHCSGRFWRCDLAGGRLSLRFQKPWTIPTLLSVSPIVFWDVSSQLILLPFQLPAAPIPCHDKLLSVWICKPKQLFSSISCLGYGVTAIEKSHTELQVREPTMSPDLVPVSLREGLLSSWKRERPEPLATCSLYLSQGSLGYPEGTGCQEQRKVVLFAYGVWRPLEACIDCLSRSSSRYFLCLKPHNSVRSQWGRHCFRQMQRGQKREEKQVDQFIWVREWLKQDLPQGLAPEFFSEPLPDSIKFMRQQTLPSSCPLHCELNTLQSIGTGR